MASQAILGNAKSLKVAVLALSGAVLLLLGVLAGSQLAGSGKAAGDREVSLSFGGVGVKMKAKELGKALDQASQAFKSGEVDRALLKNPNSPLVKLAKTQFPMKMWGAASSTLEALDKAGRGAEPRFDLLRQYVKNFACHRVYKPGREVDRNAHALTLEWWGRGMHDEMVFLAGLGETAGHLRYYHHPGSLSPTYPGLHDAGRRKAIERERTLWQRHCRSSS